MYDYNNQHPAIELEEEIEVEHNPNFDEWFKESKVVNNDKKPLIVYHGSNKKFNSFDLGKTSERLLWFSSDRNKIESGESGADASDIIYPVYLSIQKMAGWDEYENHFIEEIISMGYDGIMLDDDYIVFNPNQIKSIENDGSFDIGDNNIYS